MEAGIVFTGGLGIVGEIWIDPEPVEFTTRGVIRRDDKGNEYLYEWPHGKQPSGVHIIQLPAWNPDGKNIAIVE